MKVTVGVVHGQDVDGWFFHSMVGLHTLARKHPEIIQIDDEVIVRSGPLLSAGRGHLAASFLEHTKGEALVMFDADMSFKPETVVEMVQTFEKLRAEYGENVGMLGGLAFISNHSRLQSPLPNIWMPDPRIPERLFHQTTFPRNSLIEVGATGGACIIIHRQVFETIGRHWFHHVPALQWPLLAQDLAKMDDPAEIEQTMRSAVWDADQLGEDMSFCIRARAHGFRIFMHTGIIFDHAKSTLLGLPEYDAALATRVETPELEKVP